MITKPPFRFSGHLPPGLDDLRARQQWVVWEYAWIGKKWDKPPRHPREGHVCDGYDPKNWETFDVALETYRRLNLSGVGYSLSDNDDLTGIDLDHCYDSDTQTFTPLAKQVLAFSETYAEFSPGGDGLRLFAKGKVEKPVGETEFGIEIYGRTRYLTVTGLQVPGSPCAIQEAPQTMAFLLEEAEKARAAKQGARERATRAQAKDSFFREVNNTALQQLDNWVPTLFSTARKQATGAWRVRSSDLGRDLEEDLSIHPDGIQDFGPEVARTAIDLVLEYGPAGTVKDAALWLCDAMGAAPVSLGWQEPMKPSNPQTPNEEGDTRPIIHIGTNIRAMIEKCTSAILGLPGEPILYQRARQLAMLTFDPPPLKKVTRPPGVPSIVIPSNAYLRTLASDSANWERFDERKKRWVKTQPWTGIGPYLQSHDRWPFPQLHGVITAPTLRSDGSILESPGYDPETGLYLATTRHFPQVPEHPDYDDAKQAIARLQEPFEQFAFDGNYGLSAVLAGILTIAVRYLIDDPVPLFAISATKAGTGKSLLADTITLAATGSLPARYTPTHDPEEERKRLFALALAGTPIILIDNVIEPLGSPALDMVLTSTTLTDRILGASEQRTIPFMSTMLATGNGMQYKGDTARRVLPIDLDAMMENPEQRTGFNHEDLREYVREHHPQLVVDALTIVKSYIDAGQPKQDGLPIIGSFEKWDRLIRHCLAWLGCEDPAGGRERAMLEQDVVRGPLLALLTAWRECYGDKAKTLKIVEQDIYYHRKRPLTTDRPDRFSEHEDPISPEERGKWDNLLAALSEFDDRSNGTSISTKTIGYELRKMQGRVVDTLRLTKDSTDGHSKSVRWKVIDVSES